jgi:hypothetical protein
MVQMDLSWPKTRESPWHGPDEGVIENSKCLYYWQVRKKLPERHRSSDELPLSLRLEHATVFIKSPDFTCRPIGIFALWNPSRSKIHSRSLSVRSGGSVKRAFSRRTFALSHFFLSFRKTDIGRIYGFGCHCDFESIGRGDDGWNAQEILSLGPSIELRTVTGEELSPNDAQSKIFRRMELRAMFFNCSPRRSRESLETQHDGQRN